MIHASSTLLRTMRHLHSLAWCLMILAKWNPWCKFSFSPCSHLVCSQIVSTVLVVVVVATLSGSHTHAGVCRSQMTVPYSLELELQVSMSCLTWVRGTELKLSGRAASICSHWALSPTALAFNFWDRVLMVPLLSWNLQWCSCFTVTMCWDYRYVLSLLYKLYFII